MLWFWLALGSALAVATADALSKRFFTHLDPFEMGYVRFFYAAPWLIGPFLLTPAPEIAPSFWLVLAAALPLETAALYLYMRAIRVSPLSLTIPFLAFTPVWLILVGWLVLGELPNVWGVWGIILVAVGAYTLNLDARSRGLLGPVKAVFKEPGSWIMLVVSAVYAVTASLGKKMILLSGATFFGTFYFLVLAGLLGPLLWTTGKLKVSRLVGRPGWGLAVGFCTSAMVLTHVWSISMAPAAYMISVKRLSLVFAVFYGRLIFKETRFSQRLVGALLMFAGVILISWNGCSPCLNKVIV